MVDNKENYKFDLGVKGLSLVTYLFTLVPTAEGTKTSFYTSNL